MTFVFWQNVPNHLQSPWLSELAADIDSSVVVAVQSGNHVEESRSGLGWQLPEYHPARLEVSITPAKAERIIGEAGPEAIHIFTGVGAYPAVHNAFLQCVAKRLRIGLLAERTHPGGLLAVPRFLKSKLISMRFRRYVNFVLGVGKGGFLWYRDLGYRPERVFPFAYFPPLPPQDEPCLNLNWSPSDVKLLFIGQLVSRKGVDLLISALTKVHARNWLLNILGGGEKQQALEAMVRSAGSEKQIRFVGVLPNPKAMALLRSRPTS